MNLDGSEFMLGVGVVPASSMKEAWSLFDTYLKENKMGLLELWRCEQWDPKNYNGGSVEDGQIHNASSKH